MSERNPIRLHLGSADKHIPGFLNIDIRPDVQPDYVADVKDLSMFGANTVEEIYYCHGLEHLKYVEVQPALREWKRVLKPNGVLRLSVPDMRKLAYMYVGRLERGKGGATLAQIRGAISGGQEYPSNIHYSVWDWDTLTQALEEAGYKEIHRYHALGWLVERFETRVLKGVYFDWSIGMIRGQEISLNVEAKA
jgi:predicted SAM-dependent methyltransferase